MQDFIQVALPESLSPVPCHHRLLIFSSEGSAADVSHTPPCTQAHKNLLNTQKTFSIPQKSSQLFLVQWKPIVKEEASLEEKWERGVYVVKAALVEELFEGCKWERLGNLELRNGEGRCLGLLWRSNLDWVTPCLPQGNVTDLNNHCTLPDTWGEATSNVCDVKHYAWSSQPKLTLS